MWEWLCVPTVAGTGSGIRWPQNECEGLRKWWRDDFSNRINKFDNFDTLVTCLISCDKIALFSDELYVYAVLKEYMPSFFCLFLLIVFSQYLIQVSHCLCPLLHSHQTATLLHIQQFTYFCRATPVCWVLVLLHSTRKNCKHWLAYKIISVRFPVNMWKTISLSQFKLFAHIRWKSSEWPISSKNNCFQIVLFLSKT